VTPARLGRSGVEVTRLSFGGGPIGDLFRQVGDGEAHDAVEAAWQVGIRYFDTAPLYGLGSSERRLGTALSGRPRGDYVLSTKVGRLLDGTDWSWDFTADGVHRSLEGSLARLGTDRVDVVYLHDPDDHVEEAVGTAYPALHALRQQGVIGAIGVGVNRSEVAQVFVERCQLDCVLLAGRYTLLDRSAATHLLPACLARDVSVVLGGVFNSGVLADPDHPDARFDYRPVPDDVRARAQAMAQACRDHDLPLTAPALQLGTRHPAVASVLVGCHSRQQVEANAAHFRTRVPDSVWAQLDAL
jgi:D-threo-aldose 1-dehydrogenase